MINVLAIVPYHLDYCAGQRFRIEMWAKELPNRGISIDFFKYSDAELTEVLHKTGNNLKKGRLLVKASVKQLLNINKQKRPDVIFIYREASLVGPAIIEGIVKKWGKPIIYDLDEPLFVPYNSPANGILSRLKFFSKVNKIMSRCNKVFVVNEPLAVHARKYNHDVHVVPNTVDIERYKPYEGIKKNKEPIIAWVGTRTNQPNILAAEKGLKKLAKDVDFNFRIVADDPMEMEGVNVEFVKWKYKNEVKLLQEADIGITPVRPSVWTPWKFFFKTVQYMSLGLPVVGTKTGSNIGIIEDGITGFLVESEEDWYQKIKILIENPELRYQMGQNGRNKILKQFTLSAQIDFVESQIKSMVNESTKATEIN